MMRIVVMMLLSAVLSCGASVAAEAEVEAPPCKTAGVNPVTGHVFYSDALGGAIEARPFSMKPKCAEDSRGQWTWAPDCDPAPEGS